MQAIQKIQMASEDVKSYLVTGLFYDGEDTPAVCHDGAVVVIGDLCDHDVYTGLKDYNKHKITAPEAATDAVAIVDYVGVSTADVYNVLYKIGDKTLGLSAPAGEPTRVRVMKKYDKFFLFSGNFASTPTVGQYAIPTAGSTLWTPAAAASTDSTCLKIEFSTPAIMGQTDVDTKYFCRVVNVVE